MLISIPNIDGKTMMYFRNNTGLSLLLVLSLKDGKSPGHIIPSELIKHGGEVLTNIIREICRTSLNKKEWLSQWTQSQRYIYLRKEISVNVKITESLA